MFGAEHDAEASTLMSASYSTHADAFSDAAKATIHRGVDTRLRRGQPRSEATASTGPARTQSAAESATPASGSGAAQVAIHVHVHASAFAVDGTDVQDGALDAVLAARAKDAHATELVITKDMDVPSSRVVQLIDRGRAAGLVRVTLQ